MRGQIPTVNGGAGDHKTKDVCIRKAKKSLESSTSVLKEGIRERNEYQGK